MMMKKLRALRCLLPLVMLCCALLAAYYAMALSAVGPPMPPFIL